jgi:hypothetical protein
MSQGATANIKHMKLSLEKSQDGMLKIERTEMASRTCLSRTTFEVQSTSSNDYNKQYTNLQRRKSPQK